MLSDLHQNSCWQIYSNRQIDTKGQHRENLQRKRHLSYIYMCIYMYYIMYVCISDIYIYIIFYITYYIHIYIILYYILYYILLYYIILYYIIEHPGTNLSAFVCWDCYVVLQSIHGSTVLDVLVEAIEHLHEELRVPGRQRCFSPSIFTYHFFQRGRLNHQPVIVQMGKLWLFHIFLYNVRPPLDS